MSNATLDAIAGGRGRYAVLVSIAFPNSQTVRVGSSPYTSSSGGHFYPKILGMSSPTFTVSDRGGSLPSVEMTVDIDDTDRTISRIYSGQYAKSIRGSLATVYLANDGQASSGWYTGFAGRVTKVSFPSPFVARVALRVADDQLERPSGSAWAINRQSWPNAPAASIGKVAPICYGTWDSANHQTGPGLFGPAILVDTLAYRYVVCRGKAKTLTRVTKDGAQVAGAAYGSAFEYVTRNGRIYTCLKFTSDQGSSAIACDLVGLESVGDGTGTVISNPATQLAHKLTNFVIGDWKTGAWLSNSSVISSTYLTSAEAYFTALPAVGTDSVFDNQTGLAAIQDYCNTWKMKSWWLPAGTIATGYENVFAAPYAGTRVRWYRDEINPLSLEEDDYNITSRILVSQIPSASQGSYLSSFEVMDAGVSSETIETLEMKLSAAT